jgi:hypothetical protein
MHPLYIGLYTGLFVGTIAGFFASAVFRLLSKLLAWLHAFVVPPLSNNSKKSTRSERYSVNCLVIFTQSILMVVFLTV